MTQLRGTKQPSFVFFLYLWIVWDLDDLGGAQPVLAPGRKDNVGST